MILLDSLNVMDCVEDVDWDIVLEEDVESDHDNDVDGDALNDNVYEPDTV